MNKNEKNIIPNNSIIEIKKATSDYLTPLNLNKNDYLSSFNNQNHPNNIKGNIVLNLYILNKILFSFI